MPINTPKQRQLQRERINRVKPWLKSTGAKTIEGKNRSKMNALKISLDLYELMQEAKRMFKIQKEIHNHITKSYH